MASEIQVTTATLHSKAEELRGLNANLKTQIGELENTEASLNSMWDGEANSTFHAAFQNDIVQMNNFYNAIEKYAQVLQEIARQYENAEQANMSIASNRTY